MKAAHYPGLFAGRLKGELTQAENEQLDHHLESCATCRLEFAAMQQLWNTMEIARSPEPSPMLKAGFENMLGDYLERAGQKKDLKTGAIRWLQWKPQIPFAIQLALVLFSFAAGCFLFNSSQREQQQQLAALSGQVQELKQTMLLAMLANPSASERIKAVSFTSEIRHADEEVIRALLSTLNNDPNVNVRLSTLNALTPLANKPGVRQGLVQSITQQNSPLMQLAIAEVMLQLQEPASVKPLRQLLEQKDLDQEVRDKIGETINRLL